MTNERKDDDEKDLETLQREYRNMESNRKSLAEENAQLMRRQQQTWEKFRAENESLKMDIATLQARTTMKPLNAFEQHQLDKVTMEIEALKSQIDTQKKTNHELEKEIKTVKEDIWRQRKKMGGSNAVTDNNKNVEKQINLLENRLDQAVLKFNKALATNRKLRETIDDLRSERVAFEEVYKKLEKSLNETKRRMAQAIEKSNNAYELRDAAKVEMASILQMDRKDNDQFERQMEEMGRELEECIHAANEKRKNIQPSTNFVDEASRIANEKVINTSALRNEAENQYREREKLIQKYKNDFQRIEEATKVSDVDELVSTFLLNDESNFSLFTYTNEQAAEIKSLQEGVLSCRNKKGDFMSDNENQLIGADTEELEKKTKTLWNQTKKAEEKITKCQTELESLQNGVKMILTRLHCGGDDTSNIEINETNLLHYMGLIEEQANLIFKEYFSLEKGKQLNYIDDHASYGDDSKSSRRKSKISIASKRSRKKDDFSSNLPKIVDYSSDDNSLDDDGFTRPLTIEELKSKTIHRMNQPRKKIEFERRGSMILGRRRTTILMDGISKFG